MTKEPRKPTPGAIELSVLDQSRRRCALCFHLKGDLTEKLGQIAHLDDNPANYAEDNLAFLCMEHHSLYDSKTSQHKNYTVAEMKTARDRLYQAIKEGRHISGNYPLDTNRRKQRPPPDYDKWRHVPKLDLQTAAQLWSGEQPGSGMFGAVQETYAMLCGAIQNGELEIALDETVDPRMRSIVRQRQMDNPRLDMKVTRTALQAFAKRHNYDPEFLRDR
jgi:hypothetical protein